LLGNPELISQIEPGKGETWLYLEGPNRATRFSILFAGDFVDSATWFVEDKDPESNLVLAKGRYQGAHFSEHKLPWTNPHAAPNQEVCSDESRGLSIAYSSTQKRVDSISWFVTGARQITSSPHN
jgi:hypothetical protein